MSSEQQKLTENNQQWKQEAYYTEYLWMHSLGPDTFPQDSFQKVFV